MLRKINWKTCIVYLLLISSILFINSILIEPKINNYHELDETPLFFSSQWMFIIWNVLYCLMGLSAYMIYKSHNYMSIEAIKIYGIQILFSFLWIDSFFGYHMYFLSLLILIVLWLFVLIMVVSFHQIDKKSAYLQYPYMVWLTCIFYLNVGIWILNI